MAWSLIVPSARPENLIRSLETVFRAHPGVDPARIVIVDDGAREEASRELPAGIRWVEGVKPFVFARNVNLGIRDAPPSDVFIIMGDDVEVLSLGCFDMLERGFGKQPGLGILSPGVVGIVGNRRQTFDPTVPFLIEDELLVFICVAVPRVVWDLVGPLDERYVGYGCEDDDYSLRVRKAGYSLGVLNRSVVRHDGSIPSTFRSRPDVERLFRENRERFLRKWNRHAPVR